MPRGISGNNQKGKKGRPPTDVAELLRAKVWYLAVKARGNWSDYKLDLEFAKPEGESPRQGQDRRRAFEEIRRTGSVPTEGTHKRREFDLVRNVEAHPNFAGTSSYFHSSFWTLLQPVPMKLQNAKQIVENELKRANLHRPSAELALFVTLSKPGSTGRDMPSGVDTRHLYRASLQMYLQSAQRNLDVFALIGSLFREAYLVCALEIAVVLKDLLCEMLEEFCNQEWLQKDGTGLQLLELAESRIFHWRMDDVTNDGEGYDDLPMSVVERPLLQRNDALEWLIKNESVWHKEFFDAIRSSL
jgi:hypothetical protein